MTTETALYTAAYDAPVGRLTIGADSGGLRALVLDGQSRAAEYIPHPASAPPDAAAQRHLDEARRWLDDYFARRRPDHRRLTLVPRGTAYRRRVWRALQDIPYGTTTTYGTLSRLCGGSARSVGNAVGHNPISILIPCHRVVGTDGSLTGYAGGLDTKRRLLELEGVDHLPGPV